MGCQQRSLTNLLKDFCGIEVDKSERLSDWTCRPLSKSQIRCGVKTLNPFHHRLWNYVVQLFQRDFLCSLLRYARMDVHYLLHLAKLLMRDLASVGCIASANEMSQRMTLQLYAKPDSKTAVAAAAAIILKGETGKVWQAFPSQSQSFFFLCSTSTPTSSFTFLPHQYRAHQDSGIVFMPCACGETNRPGLVMTTPS